MVCLYNGKQQSIVISKAQIKKWNRERKKSREWTPWRQLRYEYSIIETDTKTNAKYDVLSLSSESLQELYYIFQISCSLCGISSRSILDLPNFMFSRQLSCNLNVISLIVPFHPQSYFFILIHKCQILSLYLSFRFIKFVITFFSRISFIHNNCFFDFVPYHS